MRVHESVVDARGWHDRVVALVGSGARFLDFLTAVDDPQSGEMEVVAHLVDVERRERHLVRTRVDRADPHLPTLTDVLAGAGWHEREAHEMLGVRFVGNPDLRPLLTTGEANHPLRRTTPLAARIATPWPGARDPADRPAAGARTAARPRTAPLPPGVPREWVR